MIKLTEDQLRILKETKKKRGAISSLAKQFGVNADYLRSLWRSLQPRERKCDCGATATIDSSTGWCCQRCHKFQEDYERWQRFHPQGA